MVGGGAIGVWGIAILVFVCPRFCQHPLQRDAVVLRGRSVGRSARVAGRKSWRAGSAGGSVGPFDGSASCSKFSSLERYSWSCCVRMSIFSSSSSAGFGWPCARFAHEQLRKHEERSNDAEHQGGRRGKKCGGATRPLRPDPSRYLGTSAHKHQEKTQGGLHGYREGDERDDAEI